MAKISQIVIITVSVHLSIFSLGDVKFIYIYLYLSFLFFSNTDYIYIYIVGVEQGSSVEMLIGLQISLGNADLSEDKLVYFLGR